MQQRFVDVTAEAGEAGFRCRVMVTEEVWDRCCKWTDSDTLRQGYQNRADRIREILYLPSLKMQGEADDGYAEDGDLLGLGGLTYAINCVLRGAGEGNTLVSLRIRPAMLSEVDRGLIVSFPDENLPPDLTDLS
jgi:hypothetical protein